MVENRIARSGRQPLQLRRFHIHHGPFGVQRRGEAAPGADQLFRGRAGGDAYQEALSRLPYFANALVFAVIPHLLFDALRGAAQAQLAQRDQIALAEEIADRALGLLRQIDLAFPEPLEQLVRRKIDELDLVGLVKDGIGNGLGNLNLGDAGDDVLEAFQMLHVDRGVDVDAGIEQFLDIVPALGMTRTRRIGMRQLVDDDQRRLAPERRIEIEFTQLRSAILDRLQRQYFES